MGIEELLHVPSLGKISGQLFNLVAIAGREECVEAVVLRPLPLPLDVLVERPGLAVLRGVCQLRGRIARPTRLERLRRQRPQFGTQARSIGHRHQKVEVGLGLDPVQEFDGEVFRIGQDQCLAGLGDRGYQLANFSSSSAAAAAVRAEVPVVKQTGWPVSTSSTKKV